MLGIGRAIIPKVLQRLSIIYRLSVTGRIAPSNNTAGDKIRRTFRRYHSRNQRARRVGHRRGGMQPNGVDSVAANHSVSIEFLIGVVR